MIVLVKSALCALCIIRCPRLLTQIVQVFNKHKDEVLDVSVAREDDDCINVTMTTSMNEDGGGTMGRIRAKLMAMYHAREISKYIV